MLLLLSLLLAAAQGNKVRLPPHVSAKVCASVLLARCQLLHSSLCKDVACDRCLHLITLVPASIGCVRRQRERRMLLR